MKMSEAVEIMGIERDITSMKGYMVCFTKFCDNKMIHVDHFPEPLSGETLISTEKEAWDLAKKFAEATVGTYYNIYVIDSKFKPVRRYSERMMNNGVDMKSEYNCRGYWRATSPYGDIIDVLGVGIDQRSVPSLLIRTLRPAENFIDWRSKFIKDGETVVDGEPRIRVIREVTPVLDQKIKS